MQTGIRGKGGQRISFSRVEPLPCRYLHADAETKPDDSSKDNVKESATAYQPQRAVISFGPEHAPLEARQVENALLEAATLKPAPQIIVFAAFQFDPEAAKDIDETNWPGMTLLKAQMNADMQTGDLKKKRSSNESFWLMGQPDVEVVSEQWIVGSGKEIAPYDIITKLSGIDSLAKINALDKNDLSFFIAVAQNRELWDAFTADQSGGLHSGKHSGRTGKARNGGIPAFSGDSTRFPCRIGDLADFMRRFEVIGEKQRQNCIDRLRRNKQVIEWAGKIAQTLTHTGKSLSTAHYSQVTVHGFDYFNTKSGELESGGEDKIAVWMLDTDYDGRCLYPKQVFFPMADAKNGWTKLAKNLKAEIDEDMIESYKGTVSLPFELGENKRIAVKIVDDRGIESLKVVVVE